MVGNSVDVEEHCAGYVRSEKLRLGIAPERRQIERAVDHGGAGFAEPRGEPVGGNEILGSGRAGIDHVLKFLPYTNAKRTRRFNLPFFSICVTRTAPISPVPRTCVPPQG